MKMLRSMGRDGRRLGIALLIVGVFSGDVFAQAWTRDQGEGYVNFSLSSVSGDELFGTDGELRQIAETYSQTIVGLYSELGIIDRWLTLSLNAELFRRNSL
ncbi:MAG: hypothetical protein AAFN74_26470, partial [Myxococcota bacterium]